MGELAIPMSDPTRDHKEIREWAISRVCPVDVLPELWTMFHPCSGFCLPMMSTLQPVIRLDVDTAEARTRATALGLDPSLCPSLAEWRGISTINARAESLQTSGTWRAQFRRGRCLIAVDGFYEWKTIRGDAPPGVKIKPSKPGKQPFAFNLRDGEPFAFAGLWDA